MLAVLTPLRADQSAMALWVEHCMQTFQSVDQQVPIERALYLEELAKGAEEGHWEPLEKALAEERFKRLLEKEEQQSLAFKKSNPRDQRLQRSELELLIASGPINHRLPTGTRFSRQLHALSRVKSEAAIATRQHAYAYAREAWLQAKDFSDLERAITLLLAAKNTTEPGVWTRELAFMNGRRMSSFSSPFVAEAADALCIVGAPIPLLLPDPILDPAGYTRARVDWMALREIRNHFVTDPIIHARFLELEARRATEAAIRRERLHAAMREEAEADHFRKLLADYSALFPTAPPIRPAVPPGYPYKGITYLNYKNYIQQQATRQPPFPVLSEMEAYRWWLRILEKDSGKTARPTENELRGHLSPLPFLLVETLVKKERPSEKKTAPKIVSDLPPLPALIAALHELASPQNNAGIVPLSLLSMWEALAADGDSIPELSPTTAREFWKTLAAKPYGSALFSLRERATKELLARLPAPPPASDTPSEIMLRERLEIAFRHGESKVAHRLLLIDSACGVLTPDELTGYKEALKIWQETNDSIAQGNLSKARQSWLLLLRRDPLPEVGDLAARQLRKIEASQARLHRDSSTDVAD